MNIKVEYAKTALEQALWDIRRKFTTEEYEPQPERILVHGLKPSVDDDMSLFEDWMDCKKITGLTEPEYQAKYHRAWSA